MARFHSATEIFDVWVDGMAVLTRRGDLPPEREMSAEPWTRYRELQRVLLRDGWSRVRDPAREVDYPDDPRDDALEAALRTNFDDDETWRVYADHLIERGHPRGPLMALESAPVKNIVERAEREAESRRMRLAVADVLGGALAGRAGLNLRWRRGFIDEARLGGTYVPGRTEDVLFELLRHPSARLLRVLAIDCSGDADYGLVVELLLHADPAPPLRALEITGGTAELGTLGSSYPRLERLVLVTSANLDGIALPHVEYLSLLPATLSNLSALAAASWPALHTLEIELERDGRCVIDHLQWLFDRPPPRLTTLQIYGAEFGGAIVDAFVGSPLVRQLERLDLRHGYVEQHAGVALYAARPALHPKFRLDVSQRFEDEWWSALRDAELVVDRRW